VALLFWSAYLYLLETEIKSKERYFPATASLLTFFIFILNWERPTPFCNPAMAPRSREKPAVARNSWSWNSRDTFDPATFKSVDGDKIFFRDIWRGGRQMLHWGVAALLNKSQRALIDNIRNNRVVSLETAFTKECQKQGVTQVPYRKFQFGLISFEFIGSIHSFTMLQFQFTRRKYEAPL
jgi:hypothetical protein